MIVARQFVAWNPGENGNRAVGQRMIRSDKRANDRGDESTRGKDHTVPYGTDPFLTRSRQ
jgi:hypothetical protein